MSTPATTDDEDQRLVAQSDTLRQQIEDDVKASQPLTSELLPISSLLEHYTDNGGGDDAVGFVRSARYLATKYTSMRKIRGDGNCFYRAFLFSLCEHLLRPLILEGKADEFERLDAFVRGSLKWTTECGYDEFTIESELNRKQPVLSTKYPQCSTTSSSRSSTTSAHRERRRRRTKTPGGPASTRRCPAFKIPRGVVDSSCRPGLRPDSGGWWPTTSLLPR